MTPWSIFFFCCCLRWLGTSLATFRAGGLMTPGGLRLHARQWDEQGPHRGSVLMIHGYTWHSGYFEPFAEFLRAHGYRVYTFDLPSHGQSDRIAGIKGYVDKFSSLVDAAEVALQEFAQDHPPNKPLFVFAESMGGGIAVLLGLRPSAQQLITGVILSSPALSISPNVLPPAPVVFLVKLFSNLFPTAKMPGNELEATYDLAFGDQSFAVKSRSDPLINFDPPRLRTASEILSTYRGLPKQFPRFQLPVLVLHGEDDVRTEPKNSALFVNTCGSNVKKLIMYPGMRHQLLQDKPANTLQVQKDVLDWLRTFQSR